MAHAAEPMEWQDRAGTESAGSGLAMLDDRFEIDYSQRLEGLDSPQAMAFAALDTEHPRAPVFALVTGSDVPARTDVAAELVSISGSGFLNLHAIGPVLAPERDGRRLAFIHDRPGGGRLRRGAGTRSVLTERVVAGVILPGILEGIDTLHKQGITHRAIRPGNIFFADIERDRAVLGECVSAPPGFDQQVAFEPLDRSLAMRSGRGEGTPACDMYALGVTLVMLLKGAVPSDEVILSRSNQRYESGSLALFEAGLDVSPAMMELLAGLLHDDPKGRWSVEEAYDWIGGRRTIPPRHVGPRDGLRPFQFRGAPYRSCRALSQAFAEAPQAARHALRDRALVDWIRRSYGDADLADRIGHLINLNSNGQASGTNLSDDELSLVCMALDPNGPIRYRGSAIMPDGIGPALATAMINERSDELKTIAQLIERGTMIAAIQHSDLFVRQDPRLTAARSWQTYLKFPDFDRGLELCAYEMIPGLPCLSPSIRNQSATNLVELVRALNGLVGANDPPKNRPRDRHVSAFAASLMSSSQLQAARIGAGRVPQGAQECMGDLAFFACIQRTEGTGALRGIAKWMRARLEPALDSFRSQQRRNRVATALNHAVATGNLLEMLKALRNEEERRNDTHEYNAARARYIHLTREEGRLAGLLADHSRLAVFRGRQAAAMTAMIIFMAVCVLTVTGSF